MNVVLPDEVFPSWTTTKKT